MANRNPPTRPEIAVECIKQVRDFLRKQDHLDVAAKLDSAITQIETQPGNADQVRH